MAWRGGLQGAFPRMTMLLSPPTRLLPAALSALSAKVSRAVPVGVRIRLGKLMPAMTMRLCCIASTPGVAAHGVFCAGHHFQVFWVEARRVLAQMINRHTAGYRSNENLIGDSVEEKIGSLRIGNAIGRLYPQAHIAPSVRGLPVADPAHVWSSHVRRHAVEQILMSVHCPKICNRACCAIGGVV